MAATSEITISLNRTLKPADEKAVTFLMSQWLVYDVKIRRNRTSAEIKLFHTAGAAPELVKELAELFPNESLTGM
ncbi:MAG TPA: hypothetical protein VNB22_14710 [Pyrinomonadaceae bacterium]|jgi:hypothetical protein|nr:hypothetical protein [Pyrinomonadaceae bacterium]